MFYANKEIVSEKTKKTDKFEISQTRLIKFCYKSFKNNEFFVKKF